MTLPSRQDNRSRNEFFTKLFEASCGKDRRLKKDRFVKFLVSILPSRQTQKGVSPSYFFLSSCLSLLSPLFLLRSFFFPPAAVVLVRQKRETPKLSIELRNCSRGASNLVFRTNFARRVKCLRYRYIYVMSYDSPPDDRKRGS